MDWIINNWSLIVVVIAIALYLFMSGKKSIKNWLLFAVMLAEEDLGKGTGWYKLHTVYDSFVKSYPILSKVIPFTVFSGWVDEALEKMKEQIEKNPYIKKLVEGE